MNRSQESGFTLIELLFVTALLGILITLGLQAFKEQADRSKVAKAAAQLEQYLEAGSSYYDDTQEWPSVQSLTFLTYLPVSSDNNPWGKPFIYQAQADGKRFQVMTLAPEGSAKLLASQLPNAMLGTCQDQWCEVMTEIVRPGSIGTGSASVTGIAIQALGIAQGGHTEVTFDCPAHWEGKIITALSAITMPKDNYYTSAILSQAQAQGTCHNVTQTTWHCETTARSQTRQREHGDGQANTFYIAYCQSVEAKKTD